MRKEIRGARNEVELAAAIDRELERSIGRKMTKEERDQVIREDARSGGPCKVNRRRTSGQ